jgi:regulator of sigma E protease
MIVWQIIAVALLFTLVVGIHELGHYLFAKWRGMDVEEFAIGFLKPLWQRRSKSGTVFSIRILPLGGFVRIRGMIPTGDASETRIAGGFYSKGLGSRALVLFAGPLFSFLGGFALFWLVFGFYGEPKPLLQPVVGAIAPNSPAASAGLKTGDRIVSIDGQSLKTFHEFRIVTRRSAGKELSMEVLRGSESLALTITPQLRQDAQLMGADGTPEQNPDGSPKTADVGWTGAMSKVDYVGVSFLRAATLATELSGRLFYETGRVLINPSRLRNEAGGPIAIATTAGAAAESGIRDLLMIAGFISLSLGIMNMLPIPLLDGGQLLVVGIEALRGGRRLSLATQEAIAVIGFALIALLIVSVFALDISRL